MSSIIADWREKHNREISESVFWALWQCKQKYSQTETSKIKILIQAEITLVTYKQHTHFSPPHMLKSPQQWGNSRVVKCVTELRQSLTKNSTTEYKDHWLFVCWYTLRLIHFIFFQQLQVMTTKIYAEK